MTAGAGLLDLVRRCLRPPLRDWRFWLIQILVIVIALAYWTAVLSGSGQLSVWAGELLALFLLPVVYAALNFGPAGAMATAVWVSVLSLPSLPLAPSWERGWSTVIEVLAFLGVAVFVGDRVDREIALRQEAEAARGAMRRSQARLRSLFENSPAATLLVGTDGAVREANPAAAALFGHSRDQLVSLRLADLVGADPAGAIAEGTPSIIELDRGGERHRFLRPVVSRTSEAFQVVFVDVSEERRRLGLKDAYAAYVIKAQEEERARIAQELHDEPLQTVVHLYRLLDRLSAAPDGGAPPEVRRGLDEARGVAEGIAEELRRLARGLRPASLEDLGLETALERLVHDAEGRGGLHAVLHVAGQPRRLDPLLELGLFRIAQEAIRNVERHANATRLEVGIRFERDQVGLTVEDDGRGLPDAATLDGELHGLGLVGMEERAALLGGRLDIGSNGEHGTRLTALIPAR